MSFINYTSLEYKCFHYDSPDGTFTIKSAEEDIIIGKSIVEIDVGLDDTGRRHLALSFGGMSNTISVFDPKTNKAFLQNFLISLLYAASADRLAAFLNALSIFIGEDTIIPIGATGFVVVWNETDMEWSFPARTVTLRAANSNVSLELAAIASLLWVIVEVYEKDDKSRMNVLCEICAQPGCTNERKIQEK